jgi:hypothetical protein
MAKPTTNLNDEEAQPKGDTGDGDTGVPPGEQGISNRAGDADDEEFDDEEDDSDDEEDEDSGPGL